jgi:hypothetical protein
MSPEEIQNRLSALACPICKKSGFAIQPQQQTGFAEILRTAGCLGCRYSFPVGIPTRPVYETNPDVAQWLGGLPCPSCEHLGAVMEFRCMPSVRDSYYFVTCRACMHPFHEKAPMEAFE